jgi:hypothetical protein
MRRKRALGSFGCAPPAAAAIPTCGWWASMPWRGGASQKVTAMGASPCAAPRRTAAGASGCVRRGQRAHLEPRLQRPFPCHSSCVCRRANHHRVRELQRKPARTPRPYAFVHPRVVAAAAAAQRVLLWAVSATARPGLDEAGRPCGRRQGRAGHLEESPFLSSRRSVRPTRRVAPPSPCATPDG